MRPEYCHCFTYEWNYSENKCTPFLPGPPGTPSWTHCESHCFQAAHCRGKVVKCVCCDFYQQVISVRLYLTLSSRFHTCNIFWHVSAHKDTTELLSRCLWLSLSKRAKQQTFCFSINVFYLFGELHISSSPPPWRFKPYRDSSGIQPAYGEDWRNTSEAARLWTPRSPDVRRHIVFKQTPSLWQ